MKGSDGHSMSSLLLCFCFSSSLKPLCRLIDADAHAQWNAVPRSYRLECALKACDRRPVERDFMVNMKLNYLHVKFLLRLALLRPLTTDPDQQLLSISMEMLSLVVETVMLKDQIINSGTSLVWKVSQETGVFNQFTYFQIQGRILRLVGCWADIPRPRQPIICHGDLSNGHV